MNYTGFYIISSFFIISKYSTFSKINLGIIIGLMLPDLDIFFKYLDSFEELHGGPLHSIILAIIIFIFLLIMNEIKKNQFSKQVINGLFIGIITHIFFDILFSGQKILFYWPLPINPVNSLFDLKISSNTLYILSCIKFLIFRYIGYRLIFILIKSNFPILNQGKAIHLISIFMKIQILFFLIFLLLFVLQIKYSILLIDFSMLCSIIFSLYCLYILKDIFNKEPIIGQ